MLVKPLRCRWLAKVWCRRSPFAAGLAMITFFCLQSSWLRASETNLGMERKVDQPCWSGETARAGIDPCSLLEQANTILSRLVPLTASHLRVVANDFDVERNLRVQQALFREDLIWQARGFTERQIDLMVYIAVALSLDRAGKLEEDLRRSLRQKQDRRLEQRLDAVSLYRAEALVLLSRVSTGLQNLPDNELKFYF